MFHVERLGRRQQAPNLQRDSFRQEILLSRKTRLSTPENRPSRLRSRWLTRL